MKKSILLIALALSLSTLAQENANSKRIKEIPSLIQKALKTEDYEKAASLKKEKTLRLEMTEALKKEDYAKAASLKKQIENGGKEVNPQIADLNAQMKSAIAREDYKEAGRLKKQIATLENGGTITNTTKSNSTNTSTGSNSNVPHIEFTNQVYHFRNGKISSLVKATGQLKTSGGGWGGFGGATSSYVLTGETSNIVINSNELTFIVKVGVGIDPSEYIHLVKLDVRGRRKDRYADQYKSTSSGFHTETGKVENNQIGIRYTKVEPGVYKITIPEGLIIGAQYSFMYINKMFAFTVR
jgi:protein-arginine kinase activator protein McsA